MQVLLSIHLSLVICLLPHSLTLSLTVFSLSSSSILCLYEKFQEKFFFEVGIIAKH